MSGSPPIHLSTQIQILRKNNYGHAYPLSEKPLLTGTEHEKILQIVDWLDVEKHARYQPTQTTTYCNIYATDVCYLLDVFLPRVFWSPSAIKELENGKQVVPILGKTVYELSANALYRWLDNYSQYFGWSRLSSLDEGQDSANAGDIVVICARRKIEAASGHIGMIVPETSKISSIKNNGKIILPVQSMAGGKCLKLGNGTQWWLGKEFAEYGFWKNSKNKNVQNIFINDTDPVTLLRANEGEHTPLHIKNKEDDII